MRNKIKFTQIESELSLCGNETVEMIELIKASGVNVTLTEWQITQSQPARYEVITDS